jgi:hypothetical protein
MWHVRLFCQQILYLTNTLLIQQTILVPKRQAQRHRHWFKVARNRYQTRMARVRGIDTTNTALLLSMRLQDRISSSPAEPNRAYLVRARDQAHGIDEARDQGLRDGFAVLDEPGPQCCGDYSGILNFVHQASLFAVFEGWFDIL